MNTPQKVIIIRAWDEAADVDKSAAWVSKGPEVDHREFLKIKAELAKDYPECHFTYDFKTTDYVPEMR